MWKPSEKVPGESVLSLELGGLTSKSSPLVWLGQLAVPQLLPLLFLKTWRNTDSILRCNSGTSAVACCLLRSPSELIAIQSSSERAS